jgi:TetR/AcrR family transcriptional regulator
MEKDVREKILQAAREVFIKKGYASASLREIADMAGVNKGLLHYYKWNKRKLFLSVFEDAFTKLALRVNEVFDSKRPLFEKIEGFVDRYMDMLLENPHLPAFVISELNQNPEEFVAQVLEAKRRPDPMKFLAQLQIESQAGNIKEVNPFHFFLNLLSMCVFPFMARPIIQGLLQVDEKTFNHFMGQRKEEITKFVIDAIRKD